jgi:hypothetical protein
VSRAASWGECAPGDQWPNPRCIVRGPLTVTGRSNRGAQLGPSQAERGGVDGDLKVDVETGMLQAH